MKINHFNIGEITKERDFYAFDNCNVEYFPGVIFVTYGYVYVKLVDGKIDTIAADILITRDVENIRINLSKKIKADIETALENMVETLNQKLC